MRFAFVLAQRALHTVTILCRVMQVRRSGFYSWLKRPRAKREARDRLLRRKVRLAHVQSLGRYGSPRVHEELRAQGERVSRKRVARLMSQQGIYGRKPRRFRTTTDSNHASPVAPNRLRPRLQVREPNRVWVADITYIRTREGWLYLAVILDVHSRRVVGWAAAEHMQTELALHALGNALRRRRPPQGLIHHSDRGTQYASEAYRRVLERHGVVQSMSRRGHCWDNAMAESFFSTLKQELIYRRSWLTRVDLVQALRAYIDEFYNGHRRHSAIDYLSPIDFEQREALLAAAA